MKADRLLDIHCSQCYKYFSHHLRKPKNPLYLENCNCANNLFVIVNLVFIVLILIVLCFFIKGTSFLCNDSSQVIVTN